MSSKNQSGPKIDDQFAYDSFMDPKRWRRKFKEYLEYVDERRRLRERHLSNDIMELKSFVKMNNEVFQ